MSDLYFVFLAGILGSAHCLGMCGGFVLAINTTHDRTTGVLHQGFYFFGKTVTYTLLGAAAGTMGSALAGITGAQNVLSIVAGIAMLFIGLSVLGVFDRIESAGRLAGIPGFKQALGYFLQRRSFSGTFGLGLLNGLLPCGLVYGLLMKASATGTPAGGAVTMFVFGIATIPALFALGLTGHLLRPAWRSHLNRAGGIIVILLGLMTVIRGTPAQHTVMQWLPGGSHHGAAHEMPMPGREQQDAHPASPAPAPHHMH